MNSAESGRKGGLVTGARNRAKTHCSRGHEFTPENTRHYQGERHCRPCARIRAGERAEWKAWVKAHAGISRTSSGAQ